MNYESGAIDATDVIGDGLEMIKSNYWMYVLMTVVLGVIAIAIWFISSMINQVIVYALMMIVGMSTSGSNQAAGAMIAVQGVSMGVSLLLSIITGTVMAALFCGFFKAMARTSRDGSFEFGDLFSGFQYLKACFFANLINVVLQTVITLVFLAIAGAAVVGTVGIAVFENGKFVRNPELLGALWPILLVLFVVFLIAMIVFGVVQLFVYPLVARGVSGGEAYMTSIRAGFANFGGAFLLLFLSGLMLIVATLPCGLGLPFVVPIVYAAFFRATERVFGPVTGPTETLPPTPDQYGFNSGY